MHQILTQYLLNVNDFLYFWYTIGAYFIISISGYNYAEPFFQCWLSESTIYCIFTHVRFARAVDIPVAGRVWAWPW
jgi:hypothetical protein